MNTFFDNLVGGLLGIVIVVGFLAILIVKINSLPLTLITIAVILLLLIDFVQTLRQGENGLEG